jgi:hypothetical protein
MRRLISWLDRMDRLLLPMALDVIIALLSAGLLMAMARFFVRLFIFDE